MRNFNYDLLQNCSFDCEILGLVAQIHEYKGRQELYLKQQSHDLDRLVEIAKIQSTEASNKIEGIITTSTRIKQLMSEKTTPKNRDEQEIMGYRDVLNTIHENYEYIPIRSSYILQLHRDLYQFSEKSIGGRYKNTQNVIAQTLDDGTMQAIFTPIAPYETEPAIEQICESFNHVIDSCTIDPLILIPIFIHDFLCIHPFNDGNGRMSRLLTTLLFYRSGYVVGKYISIENKIEKTKSTYYDVLQQCGVGWHEETENPIPFVKYILSIMVCAYKDFELRVDYVAKKIPAIEQVQNAILKKIGKFTKSDIMELTPNLSKSSIENSLKKLVENKSIIKHQNGKNTFYTRND